MFFNGSTNTGVVGDLGEKKAHFAFNAQAYAPYNFLDTVEQSNAYDHIKFCVIVPRKGIKPIAFNIFHTLSTATWLMVIGSIIFILITFTVVQRVQKEISPENHKYYSFIEFTAITLQSFFGDSIERIIFSFPIRWIFIGWLTYSFLITNAFTATIISSLIKPNHLSNINTIVELGESNLSILYPKVLRKNLENGFDNETWQLIGDNLKEIESWERFVDIVNRNKTQYAYVIADYIAHYMVNSNIDKRTGESIFHMVPECLVSHPKVYLFQRGSMYLGFINELLGQFHEMGMFRRWIREMNFWSMIKGLRTGNRMDRIDYSAVKVVITLEYLQTPFYMLGAGLLVSLNVFLIERWWYKRMGKKLNPEMEENDGEEFELK